MTDTKPVTTKGPSYTTPGDSADGDVLLASRRDLYLPPFVRAAWQRRHPDLVLAGTSPLVPSTP